MGSGRALLALRADWREQLRRAHFDLGLRHVRFHGMLDDDMGTLICVNEQQSIFGGVPINVTLLFSRAQYVAAAEAYLRGVERRIAVGLDPKVASVASLFVSRWDVATHDTLPAPLRNRLGIAVAKQTYRAYCELLASPRWRKLAATGARMQRLL